MSIVQYLSQVLAAVRQYCVK